MRRRGGSSASAEILPTKRRGVERSRRSALEGVCWCRWSPLSAFSISPIEQDADVVLGLYRDAYYLEHKADRTDVEEDRLARCLNTLEIEILKQRSGPTIRIECFCDVACNVLAEAR